MLTMTAEKLVPLPDEDTLRLMRVATYLFLLLLPLTVLIVLGSTSTQGALALYTQRGFYISDLPLAAILVLALTTSFKWRRGPWFMTLPLILLVVLAFLAIPGALSPPFALYSALRWLVAFSVYLWFVQPLVPARPLLGVFVASATLYGVLFLAGLALDGSSSLAAGSASPWAPAAVLAAAGRGISRFQTQGILPSRELLTAFLAVAFILNVSLLTYWQAIVAWWILGVALLATMSGVALAAVLAVLVPLILWHYRRRRRWRRRILGAVSGLVASLFLASILLSGALSTRLGPLWSYLWDGSDTSAEVLMERWSLAEWAELNRVAWRAIGQRPLLGAGAGNFPHAMLRVETMATVQNARNVPLLLGAEVGMGGLLLWLFVWLAVAVAVLWRLRTRSAWLLASMCAWLALGFIALFYSFPWALNQGRLLTAVTLGLVGRGLSRRR